MSFFESPLIFSSCYSSLKGPAVSRNWDKKLTFRAFTLSWEQMKKGYRWNLQLWNFLAEVIWPLTTCSSWRQILVFPFPTDMASQFLYKVNLSFVLFSFMLRLIEIQTISDFRSISVAFVLKRLTLLRLQIYMNLRSLNCARSWKTLA